MNRVYGLLACFFLIGCSAPPAEIKVATYHINWLDEGISQARSECLQMVVSELNADIIGFQGILSRKALENILPADYDIGILDDPEALQKVALAVRKPFVIDDFKFVFPEEDYNRAFPEKRDLLEVRVAGHGRHFTIYVHHARSRSKGRIETDLHREAAAQHIVQYLLSRVKNDHIILMGDFNDNPDDRSLNILEFGNPDAQAGIDDQPDTFLYNITEDLAAQDHCSFGYNSLYNSSGAPTFNPVVGGSRDENNRRRHPSDAFHGDVKAILVDQILVSQNLKNHVYSAGIFNQASAVKGVPSRIQTRSDSLIYTHRGDLASDHVPVWAVLKF